MREREHQKRGAGIFRVEYKEDDDMSGGGVAEKGEDHRCQPEAGRRGPSKGASGGGGVCASPLKLPFSRLAAAFNVGIANGAAVNFAK